MVTTLAFSEHEKRCVARWWQMLLVSAARKPATAILLVFALVQAGGDLRAAPPNIMFIFADDWGRHASSYAEMDEVVDFADFVQTPSFDRIAREGVLFRNAFVNAPSCTPCRSSLLTGRYFWQCGRGAILQGARWESSIPSWPPLLEESGYRLGRSAKVWRPGEPQDAEYGDKIYAYESAGTRLNQFSHSATRLVASGTPVVEAKQEILDEVGANFKAFLADRRGDEPFCYWFGPTTVHRPWKSGSGVAIWGLNPDDFAGKLPPYLPDVPAVRDDLADYLGEVQAFDAALGRLLTELEESGEYENTLIIISGDHGPPGFPHGKCNLYDFGTRVALAIAGPGVHGGRVVDDFVCLPDLAPTILQAAGARIPDSMGAQSIWPVLESDGAGPIDPSRDAIFAGRERHVASARSGYLPYPQRAIRTADYLFIVNFHPERYPLGDPYRLEGRDDPTTDELSNNTFVTLPDEDAGPTKAWIVSQRNDPERRSYYEHAYGQRPREELFDLHRDPHQMHNVAADPKYKSVVNRLRRRLMNELERTGDPRLIDNGKYFESPPLAGPLPDENG